MCEFPAHGILRLINAIHCPAKCKRFRRLARRVAAHHNLVELSCAGPSAKVVQVTATGFACRVSNVDSITLGFLMKRQLICLFLATTALGAQAASGSIRFVGALVEPTCQAGSAPRAAAQTQVNVQLSDCRTNSLQMASSSRIVVATRIFTGVLQEFKLSAPVAAIAGRHIVQELVINYQ